MENSMVAPQKVKNRSYHIIQQFHAWVYIQENWKQGLKEVSVYPWS